MPGTPAIAVLGDAMLWTTTAFARVDTQRGRFIEIRAQYQGDLPLFEIAAYMLFRLDLWLFKEHPKHRKFFVDALFNHVSHVFADALGIDVSFTLQSRLCAYGAQVRKGTGVHEFHQHLKQMLWMSRNSTNPVDYRFDGPFLLAGIDEDFWFNSELNALEHIMIPAFSRSIEKFIEVEKPLVPGSE